MERKDLRTLADRRGAVLVTVEREDRLPEYVVGERLSEVRQQIAAEGLEAALDAEFQVQHENEPDPDAEIAAKAAEGLRLLGMLQK